MQDEISRLCEGHVTQHTAFVAHSNNFSDLAPTLTQNLTHSFIFEPK